MSSTDKVAPTPYPETRFTVWAKSLGVILVGIASVIVSWTAVNIQRSVAENQKANSLEDLALKHKTFEHERETDEARLAASLIPLLKCNDDLQRASAFQLLSKQAPSYGVMLGDVILQKCSGLSAPMRTELSRIQEQSRIQQEAQDFSIRLSNAREYKNKGYDGPAARLFEEARGLLPERYASKVNKEELEKAKQAFDDGRFTEAADRFVIAFRAIQDLP